MSDINIKNITGGDVLSYRPIVKYSKEKRYTYVENSQEIVAKDMVLTEYSTPTLILSRTLPSKALNDLKISMDDIDSYTSTIEKQISNYKVSDINFDDYKVALTENNTDVVETYTDFHFNDINGSTDVEIYNTLMELKDELKDFNDIYSSISYGNSKITFDEASEIDKAKLDKLLKYEENSMFNKINYAAINSDIQINIISIAYASASKDYANNLYMLTLKDACSEINDPKGYVRNTISNSFDSISTKSSQDRNKHNLTLNNNMISSNLINAVNSKTKLMDAISTKSKLQVLKTTTGYMAIINKSLEDAETKALSSVVDYNKTILLSSLNREDIINSIKEKSDLRNVFSGIK